MPVAPSLAQVWTGALSTTWSTAGNWTGGVPGNTATATFDSNTANDPNLNAAATVGRLLFNSGSDAEVFTGSALTLNGVSGTGIDNQSGVTQTFNNTLVVAAAQTWNADSGNLSFGAVTLSNNLTFTGSTTFDVNGTLLLNGGNRTFTNNATGTVTLSGGVTGNTRTLTVAGTGDTSITGAIATTTGGLIKTGTGTLTMSGANTYTGVTTLGTAGGTSAGTLRLGASDILSNATTTVYAGTLDLNNFSDTIGALTLGGGAAGTAANVTTGTGTLTLGGNVTYTATNNPDGATVSGLLNLGGANRTFTIGNSTAAADDLTVSADIAGSVGLIKAGTGTLVLSGANTYTGLTQVTAGVLNIRNSAALGTTAAGTTVTTGEELQLQGGIAVGAEALSITGTGVSTTGALRNISGNNSFAGVVTLTGASRITADADTLTLSGGITATNQSLTFAGAGDLAVTGAITTGSGTLTKLDGGTLTLSGTNTYTGATTISLGVVNLQNAAGLGTAAAGTTVAGGAELQLQGGIAVGAETLSLAGTGFNGSGALRNVSGNNSWSGNVTLAADTTIGSDAGLLTLSGGITGNTRTLTVAGAGNTTLSGAITTTTGGLIKEGAGTLTLSGTNTYTGATTVNAGTLLLGTAAVLSDSSAVTVASGATLDLNGQTETIASLAGAGSVTFNSGTLIAAGNASTTFSGTFDGMGTFTKQGSGILTLDTNLDFSSGTFNLGGGTLRLTDMTLNLGTLNLTGSSTIDFAGTSASLLVSTLNLNGFTLSITNWTNAVDYFFAQNWSGAVTDTRNAAPMNQVAFGGFTAADTQWQGYDSQVTPVPEPSTYGGLLLGALTGCFVWRRLMRRPAC